MTDKKQQDLPINYRQIRGHVQHAHYKGFYISLAAANDKRPIDTSSSLYNFKVENTLPRFLFNLKQSRENLFGINVYSAISRITSISLIAVAIFLGLQEKSKPLGNVFLTTADGRNYAVPAYTDIDDALKATIPQEPRPQIADFEIEKYVPKEKK